MQCCIANHLHDKQRQILREPAEQSQLLQRLQRDLPLRQEQQVVELLVLVFSPTSRPSLGQMGLPQVDNRSEICIGTACLQNHRCSVERCRARNWRYRAISERRRIERHQNQAAELHLNAYESVLAQLQGHMRVHKQHLQHPVLLAIPPPNAALAYLQVSAQ